MNYIEAIKGKIQAIRQGKYSEGDIKLVCEIIFLGQLEWNEYPSQDKIEDVIDAVEKQREELREEFDADLIRKLNAKIKAGDVNAMVLLGQYYYDCPKDQQIEDLLVKEYVDKEFMGGAGCEDEVSRKRIDTIQQKASGLFYSAYEAGSILVLYYLIKLWENNTIDTPTPSDLKLYFEKKWKSGELSQTGFDIKALLTIKSAIYVAVERQDKIKLEKNENAVKQLNQKLEVHSQQLSKILSMIYHNLQPQINMLWSYIEQPNHNQIFRESIGSMSLLLDIAKKASNNPEIIREAMCGESIGEEDVAQVIKDSIYTTVVNLLSESNIVSISQHYYSFAIKNKLVPADLSVASWEESYGRVKQDIQRQWAKSLRGMHSDQLRAWYSEYLGGITVSVNAPSFKIIKHGVRYGILQSIFMELIGNAVKYGKGMNIGGNPTELRVSVEGEYYRFECLNAIDDKLAVSGKGSGRGHDFINLILESIGQNPLLVERTDNSYRVKFFMSRALLGG